VIRVNVLYANDEGKRFDMAYYTGKHLPLVREKLGVALKGMTLDAGLAGGAPGSKAPFVAMVHMLFDSAEAFQAAFGPHAKVIMADIPNYTDIQPTIQISDAKL
jgi:uncharacterized protein (TIGR02118 family)